MTLNVTHIAHPRNTLAVERSYIMSDAPATPEAKTIRPNILAEELGIDPKRLRNYLRKTFTRDAAAKNTAWDLTPETADAIREHFAAKAS